MKKQVLLFGTLVPEEMQQMLMQKGISPAPADVAQKYILKGLMESGEFDRIASICAPRFAAFPSVRLPISKHEDWQFEGCHVQTVGFWNFSGVNILHRQSKILRAAGKWAKAHREDDVLVLLYSMHTPFLKAAEQIKRYNSNTKVAMIVADLPVYMSKYTGLKKMLKDLDCGLMKKHLSVVDKYILYTEPMAEYLGLSKGQYMVMEGLFDTAKIDLSYHAPQNEKKICIYAGSLSMRYAVDRMIEAFEKSDVDGELRLYGPAYQWEPLSKKFPELEKVRYMGRLSPEQMFETMRCADLLINPRPSSLVLSQYSFPSKTFEYMATGVPVLMTKLPGMPEEYYPHLFFFEDESLEGFIKAFRDVLSSDEAERRRKGHSAASFILKEKNCRKQVERIIRFCRE